MSSTVFNPLQPEYESERRSGEHSRADLIRQFNEAVGIMNAELAHMQSTFIAGLMPREEAAAYERYCRYMIATAHKI